ncbi:unnamed protein product [Ambrosiozyma monospora]|uniref:Unnamed protein product n=1 Tax=Ambrosiozyma monospora TaxID=43982 RepID=A0ACB5SRC4_AMBMO|nr:unnamed protein product [Ambrosiozyma monospora]
MFSLSKEVISITSQLPLELVYLVIQHAIVSNLSTSQIVRLISRKPSSNTTNTNLTLQQQRRPSFSEAALDDVIAMLLQESQLELRDDRIIIQGSNTYLTNHYLQTQHYHILIDFMVTRGIKVRQLNIPQADDSILRTIYEPTVQKLINSCSEVLNVWLFSPENGISDHLNYLVNVDFLEVDNQTSEFVFTPILNQFNNLTKLALDFSLPNDLDLLEAMVTKLNIWAQQMGGRRLIIFRLRVDGELPYYGPTLADILDENAISFDFKIELNTSDVSKDMFFFDKLEHKIYTTGYGFKTSSTPYYQADISNLAWLNKLNILEHGHVYLPNDLTLLSNLYTTQSLISQSAFPSPPSSPSEFPIESFVTSLKYQQEQQYFQPQLQIQQYQQTPSQYGHHELQNVSNIKSSMETGLITPTYTLLQTPPVSEPKASATSTSLTTTIPPVIELENDAIAILELSNVQINLSLTKLTNLLKLTMWRCTVSPEFFSGLPSTLQELKLDDIKLTCTDPFLELPSKLRKLKVKCDPAWDPNTTFANLSQLEYVTDINFSFSWSKFGASGLLGMGMGTSSSMEEDQNNNSKYLKLKDFCSWCAKLPLCVERASFNLSYYMDQDMRDLKSPLRLLPNLKELELIHVYEQKFDVSNVSRFPDNAEYLKLDYHFRSLIGVMPSHVRYLDIKLTYFGYRFVWFWNKFVAGLLDLVSFRGQVRFEDIDFRGLRDFPNNLENFNLRFCDLDDDDLILYETDQNSDLTSIDEDGDFSMDYGTSKPSDTLKPECILTIGSLKMESDLVFKFQIDASVDSDKMVQIRTIGDDSGKEKLKKSVVIDDDETRFVWI